jgi:CheY-like chemotaxis protein
MTPAAASPPELQDRIFEPFFTTKSASGGSGLGLSICRAITAEMGGTLRVESQNGRGTTFTLELPTPRGLPDEGRRSPVPAAVAALLRVLVIDDEPLVGRAVERILAPGTVEVAVGGRAGLDRVLHDGPWDAILCDLVMPDLSGTDVFEAATRVRPALARRFVFMSGGAFTPRLRAFIDENPERCLGKPVRQRGAARRDRSRGPGLTSTPAAREIPRPCTPSRPHSRTPAPAARTSPGPPTGNPAASSRSPWRSSASTRTSRRSPETSPPSGTLRSPRISSTAGSSTTAT